MSLRTTGQFLLAGALGLTFANIIELIVPGPDGLTGPGSIPADVVAVVSGIVAIVGLPALYRIQASRTGLAGRLGVVLLCLATFCGIVVSNGVQFLDVAAPGSVPHDRPDGPPTFLIIIVAIGILSYVVGGLAVGIVSLRARVLPAGLGWLLIAAVVLVVLSNVLLPPNTAANEIGKISVTSVMFVAWAWAGTCTLAQQPVAVAG